MTVADMTVVARWLVPIDCFIAYFQISLWSGYSKKRNTTSIPEKHELLFAYPHGEMACNVQGTKRIAPRRTANQQPPS